MSEQISYSATETHQKFAKSIYNDLWKLLDKTNRSLSDDEDLILGAHASLYHWKKIGTEANLQRGYWMLSRVYQSLEDADSALKWAVKCQEITEKHPNQMEDFDLAFSQECLARAYALAGNLEKASEHHQRAMQLGEKIQGSEDKVVFINDLNSGEWHQFSPTWE